MSSASKEHMPWRFQLLHHALVAATIASAMLVAETLDWLGWLDAVMLRVTAPQETGSRPLTALPTVVTINDKAYADDFRLQSPLPREPLEKLIGRITEANPAVLVIDLQLEPAIGETKERSIDKALLAAANKQVCPGRTMQIALPIPERRTPELDAASLDWMRKMCNGGVQFARATIRSHFGTVVRYDLDPSTLAMTAFNSLSAAPSPATAAECKPASMGCALACRAGSLKDVHRLIESDQQIMSTERTRPIPPSLLRQLDDQHLNSNDPKLTSLLAAHSAPHVVVLGGNYDSRDRAMTHAGEYSGVFVHAAAIGGHGMIKDSHVIAWVADVLIGIVLGVLFDYAWRGAAMLRQWLSTELAQQTVGGWTQRGAVFYAGLLCQLAIWSLPLLLMLVMLRGSGMLIDHNYWLNPGPVIIGMFLHTLLMQNAKHHTATTAREFVQAHPATVLAQLPFVLFAWAFYGLDHWAH